MLPDSLTLEALKHSASGTIPNLLPNLHEQRLVFEPLDPQTLMNQAIAAVACVKSGDTVFIGSGCAAPNLLINALAARAEELEDVEIIHLMHMGDAPYVKPGMEKHFRHNAFFTGGNVRAAVREGRADYTPIFLGEVPGLLRSGQKKVDVVLVQVTPPDFYGYCSLGIDSCATLEAVRTARSIVAEVNPRMPYVHGENFVHMARLSATVFNDHPLIELERKPIDEASNKIGEHVAEMIPDRACLQLGIGNIPDAVLSNLRDKKDLGMHTEMFSDGAVDLIKAGVLTCAAKNFHKDKIIASFVLGTRQLYAFLHGNPLVEFHPVDHTNDPFLIAQNDNMIAVNSAIEVDLTGQVCSDSIGTSIYSGFGGQVDFIRGAARSKGGKPIIALRSTAKGDKASKIVPMLMPGAGVVTSRADVHYVVTEYGVAFLHGKTLRERARSLIAISHPRFRDKLLYDAREMGLLA